MMKRSFKKKIDCAAELEAIIGTPTEMALKKQLTRLDRHMVAFISQSPFLLVATVGRDGLCDVSPRGDAPGFVCVPDDETLLIPERRGNRRVDSLHNIVETGSIGLLFLIPGVSETLRVNGRAQVIQDEDVLEPMTVQGKRPLAAIAMEIGECYLQCGKALLRSDLWAARDNAAQPVVATFAEMLMDQLQLENTTVAAVNEHVQRSYMNLY